MNHMPRARARILILLVLVPMTFGLNGCLRRRGMGGPSMGNTMAPGAPGGSGGTLGSPSPGAPMAPTGGNMSGQPPVNASLQPPAPSAPANGGSAAGGTSDPEQRGWCDRFLARVNQLRQGLGQNPLQYDESMFQQCLKRVGQMNAKGGGMDMHAGWEPQFGKEILAEDTGPESTADTYFSLGAGEGHYDTLYTPEVTRGAGAVASASSIAITDKSSMAE